MSKPLKITPQLRIRACDRILKKTYSLLRTSTCRKERSAYAIEFEEHLQDRVNYYEEYKDRLEIVL